MNNIKKKFLGITLYSLSLCAEFCWVPFDQSMKSYLYEEFLDKGNNRRYFSYYHLVYNHMRDIVMRDHRKILRIPKIIHQIWLGPKDIPHACKEYMKSWLHYHPDWQYHVWTDSDIEHFDFGNRDLFDKATNYGEKADILRYAILNEYGGVYLDIDMECVKAFDELHEMFDFYIALQPLDTNILQVGIGVIGAYAHHPILELIIDRLAHFQHEKQIICRTGPVYFTYILRFLLGKTGLRDIILPASYFYPRGYSQSLAQCNEWLCPESYAIHHWAGSWL